MRARCAGCHSADYVSTQPPAMAAGFWQAEVTKMVRVYGAPIPDPDVGPIVAYLKTAYPEKAPAPAPAR